MMGQFTGHHASIRRERDGATGDAVIQRNTMHAWKNPTSAPVYWVVVLVPIRQRG